MSENEEMSGHDVLAEFERRMARFDNLDEWRMRMCGMRAEADAEKKARISAMERGEA